MAGQETNKRSGRTDIDHEQEFLFDQLDPQKHLFRFRSLVKDKIEKELKVITEGTLWFSSPALFNDPFDCKTDCLEYSNDRQEKSAYIDDWLIENRPWLNEGQRKEIIDKCLKNEDHFTGESEKQALQDRFNGYGVCCFSKDVSELLLWSHYADGHRGMCLVFNQDNSFFRNAHHVNYLPTYPILVGWSQPDDLWAETIFYTKSESWVYEKEWRLYEIKKANQPVKYPEGSLVGVIFGCQVKDSVREYVIRQTIKMKPIPRIYQARKKHKTYGLEFFPLMVQDNGIEVVWPELAGKK